MAGPWVPAGPAGGPQPGLDPGGVAGRLPLLGPLQGLVVPPCRLGRPAGPGQGRGGVLASPGQLRRARPAPVRGHRLQQALGVLGGQTLTLEGRALQSGHAGVDGGQGPHAGGHLGGLAGLPGPYQQAHQVRAEVGVVGLVPGRGPLPPGAPQRLAGGLGPAGRLQQQRASQQDPELQPGLTTGLGQLPPGSRGRLSGGGQVVAVQRDDRGQAVAEQHPPARPDVLGQLDAGLALGGGVVPVTGDEAGQGRGPLVDGQAPLGAELLAEQPSAPQRVARLLQPVQIE